MQGCNVQCIPTPSLYVRGVAPASPPALHTADRDDWTADSDLITADEDKEVIPNAPINLAVTQTGIFELTFTWTNKSEIAIDIQLWELYGTELHGTVFTHQLSPDAESFVLTSDRWEDGQTLSGNFSLVAHSTIAFSQRVVFPDVTINNREFEVEALETEDGLNLETEDGSTLEVE